ncbi:Acid sphingomyelinase-like phosphodiesterase 3b [Homalodisca vitripennis]|nr:Acid sphingomyelinase-like phosphodiesterase 3b [Homalodisca vitripennis]
MMRGGISATNCQGAPFPRCQESDRRDKALLGMVIDYVQYYLDLATANQRESADWTIEYNLTTYYGFHKVSASEFHDLAESFTITDGLPLFARYYLVNSVSTSGLMTSMNQAHNHYCAITRLDTDQFYNCLATAPSALFSDAQPNSSISNTVFLVAFMISLLSLVPHLLQVSYGHLATTLTLAEIVLPPTDLPDIDGGSRPSDAHTGGFRQSCILTIVWNDRQGHLRSQQRKKIV